MVGSYEDYERQLYRGSGSGAAEGLSDGTLLQAKASCYSCLWEAIEGVLSIPRTVQGSGRVEAESAPGGRTIHGELFRSPALVHEIVLGMVARVTGSTDDVELHNVLYSRLYEMQATDVLLQLDSNVFFEDYFRQVDPLLLYK